LTQSAPQALKSAFPPSPPKKKHESCKVVKKIYVKNLKLLRNENEQRPPAHTAHAPGGGSKKKTRKYFRKKLREKEIINRKKDLGNS
jgi:hypothetical protein